jgi:hypothetical protein
MSHPDEGRLTALVDNELTAAERSAVEAHLMICEDCRRLFEEVKAVATEADGLVTAIELPPSRPLAPLRDTSAARPPSRNLSRPGRGTAVSPGAPIPDSQVVWSPRWRSIAWAASLLLAVGLGWVAGDMQVARRQETLSDAAADSRPPATAQDAARAEPQPAELPRAQSEEKVAPQQNRPAKRADGDAAEQPAAPRTEPPQPALAQAAAPTPAGAAAAARELDARGNLGLLARKSVAPSAAAAVAESAPADELSQRRDAGFRRVEMEEAVRVLSGSIRLVDGLQPERVLIASGALIRGADPALPLVRVVYDDPPGREMWLDMQRPADVEGARYRDARSAVLVGDTVITRGAAGSTSVRWIDEHGFRLVLTGYLAADSLNALIHRIH